MDAFEDAAFAAVDAISRVLDTPIGRVWCAVLVIFLFAGATREYLKDGKK